MFTNTAVASAVTSIQCHKLIAKVNNQKNSDMKFFLQSVWGKTPNFLSTENIKLWTNK